MADIDLGLVVGETGPAGPTGPTGPTGPQGETGPAGNTDYYVYGGSFVKTVTATREPVVFSNAEARNMFHVASGDEKEIGLTITNGDYSAQPHRITAVQYRSSSGWSAYLDGNASAGAFRFNYVAVVPKSKSTL